MLQFAIAWEKETHQNKKHEAASSAGCQARGTNTSFTMCNYPSANVRLRGDISGGGHTDCGMVLMHQKAQSRPRVIFLIPLINSSGGCSKKDGIAGVGSCTSTQRSVNLSRTRQQQTYISALLPAGELCTGIVHIVPLVT